MFPRGRVAGLLALGAACAAMPDLDVAGLAVGLHLDHPLGHRGLSHSLTFAATFAAGLTALLPARPWMSPGRARIWLFFFLAIASHGVLDALTNGGRGVAFWAPFSDARYHFPVTPIEVSPIGARPFFSSRGLEILLNELTWVWLPTALVVLAGRVLTRGVARGARPAVTQSPIEEIAETP